MSMNQTPRGERTHIALFGKRNAGKSSVINALTDQDLAIVSEVKGTTTDPVYKAMELLPLGPIVLIDTPGLDDEGELGQKRVEKTLEVLAKTDIAMVIVDSTVGVGKFELGLLEKIRDRKLPYVVVYNKKDLCDLTDQIDMSHSVCVSAKTGEGIRELKEHLGRLVPEEQEKLQIVGDLLEPSDFVVLVVPIDKAAPKGRLILPQQQTIRDILESDAAAIVVKEHELRETLQNLGKKPKMVITDSQVFSKVAADTPEDILLTSFSILFARFKGDLEEEIRGVKALDSLKDGDKILIAEGCTHHRQCDDIGTVKIPRWLSQYTGKRFQYDTCSGNSFPQNLSEYQLVIHCGGCTLNRKEMKNRLSHIKSAEVPVVNYGILIAAMQGILKRSIEPFPLAAMILDEDMEC
ncbi:MAG TPA: [FeFe] hydrogenase H-cluster maturation GTPase HydF [Candidatus Fimousia stercorigallinarum]|nr:[FeFe] hydrogenase H-cluster maturation GTPase HydF [Candidatus Fimousia stercorigallinarum]